MKDYHEMAESVLKRRDAYVTARKKRVKQALAAACCLCILLGVGVWQRGLLSGLPGGSVLPGGTTVPAADALQTPPLEQARPVTDPWEDRTDADPSASGDTSRLVVGDKLAPPATKLTEEELYEMMGRLLPGEAPAGLAWESACLYSDGCSVLWSAAASQGLDELWWSVRDYRAEDARCITGVDAVENYDLSLYPIPRYDSVPAVLQEIVNCPIFPAGELTQAAVEARAYRINGSDDSSGDRMHFSVLYGDKVVTVTSKGVSPVWLYRQLSTLGE